MVIDDKLPVADGIIFDDTLGFGPCELKLLKDRHVLFATKFRNEDNGREYGGTIIAPDIEAANVVAFGRGLGEEILGELV